MKSVVLALAATFACIVALSVSAQTASQSNPVWTSDNKLALPVGYRQWIYMGSPVTPEGLNENKAGFPEFHNVYVPKAVLDAFKKTGEYPQGAMFVKELQLTLPPSAHPDGSRDEVSGRGYFPGVFNGLDVMVKDSKRCAATNNWCFFNFGHHAQPYEKTSAIMAAESCAACHTANADKDMHFTQFYQLLLPGQDE